MDPGEFIEAIVRNDVAAVRGALAAEPALALARDDHIGSTPLHFAAHRGFGEIVRALLEAGANVHALEGASGTTPLHWAAEGGHPEIARSLVERGAELEALDGWYRLAPLGWATVVDWAPPFHADKPRTAAYLLEAGARLDPFTAIVLGRADALRALAAADPGVLARRLGFVEEEMTPLHLAVSRRGTEMARVLLELGADLGARTSHGFSPLAIALRHQDSALVALFKRHGVRNDPSTAMIAEDFDTMETLLDAEPEGAGTRAARTALLFGAVHEGMEEAVELLLGHGADPTARAKLLLGEIPALLTPLHLAAMRGQVACAETLLEGGAEPDLGKAEGGPTPLHLAAGSGHPEVVRLLLEHGADPSAREKASGATPLAWAEHEGHAEVVTLLRGGVDEE